MWYCQFDVSPVNYSDIEQNGHNIREKRTVIKQIVRNIHNHIIYLILSVFTMKIYFVQYIHLLLK